jgi:hypothetical protein
LVPQEEINNIFNKGSSFNEQQSMISNLRKRHSMTQTRMEKMTFDTGESVRFHGHLTLARGIFATREDSVTGGL